MKTLTEIINALKSCFEDVQIRFLFPNLYIFVVGDIFEGKDNEARLSVLTEKTCITEGAITGPVAESGAILLPLSQTELERDYFFILREDTSTHWLSIYSENFSPPEIVDSTSPRVIHFYGQKGGQGRSTVVGALARSLSENGHRVLVVDADIEAPTLNVIFGIEQLDFESTLMAYASSESKVSYTSNPDIPGVYFIGCRPTSSRWEIDYAAFTLRCSLDPTVLHEAVSRLRNLVSENDKKFDFDIILIDHRTGASNSVIPVMNAWPGSCVVFTRPDNQTTWFKGFETLFSFCPSNPGAIVSFSLDSQRIKGDVSAQEAITREALLEALADAIAKGAEDPEPLASEVLEQYYIGWMYDRAFFSNHLPKISQLQSDNIDSLRQLREVLGITSAPERAEPETAQHSGQHSPSGAVDNTWFVESDMTRSVLDPNSRVNYVFGRKGTGKSRLFREAYDRNIGLPILAPSEFGEINEDVLKSSDALVVTLLAKVQNDYRLFWWLLVLARLRAESSDVLYRQYLSEYADLNHSELVSNGDPTYIKKHLKPWKLTLLVDGVETVVPASQIRPFVEGLFSCMRTVQNDSEYKHLLDLKLFLRIDLVVGIQNIEQQIAGRKIELHWSEQAQMNYVLACLAYQQWLQDHFPTVCQSLKSNKNTISRGQFSVEDCESLILLIFPESLKRSNIKTITFVKTYFRDASSHFDDHRATFYPRLFFNFVAYLTELISGGGESFDQHGRISQSIIFEAYEKAARAFMSDTQQELKNAIYMDDDNNENERLVNKLVHALEGKSTPFDLDAMIRSVHAEFDSKISKDSIKDAFYNMKAMGMFEETPKDTKKWRAGRVYKSALRMKFVRGKRILD